MRIPSALRHLRSALAIAWAFGGVLILVSADGPAQQRTGNVQDVRYVVLHSPGPAWQADRSVFNQPGIDKHIAHYREWLAAGKLEMGGPYLDTAGGGMMIPIAGVSEDDVRRFANDDPAVKDGILVVQVRPWLVGMSRQR